MSRPVPIRRDSAFAERESVRLLEVLDRRLEGRHWLCGGPGRGSFTLADIACYGYAASHWWAGLDVSGLPNLRRWLGAVGARPAVAASMRVPGVGVFGETGPTFEDLRTGPALREKVEASAERGGRPYFGWKDLASMFTKDDAVPFASHVSVSGAGGGGGGSSAAAVTLAAAAALVVCAVFMRGRSH